MSCPEEPESLNAFVSNSAARQHAYRGTRKAHPEGIDDRGTDGNALVLARQIDESLFEPPSDVADLLAR